MARNYGRGGGRGFGNAMGNLGRNVTRGKNELGLLVRNLEILVTGVLSIGIKSSAEKIVSDLQKAGPSWTGSFSNSYQVATSSGVTGGTGQPGEARPINVLVLTGKELLLDGVKYTISNTSDHADVALDLVSRSDFERPGGKPQTAQGMAAWEKSDEGRTKPSLRGEIGGGDTRGESSRTAPLDWYDTYLKGAGIEKTIKLQMDRAFQRAPR
jgi:hypothetical protein